MSSGRPKSARKRKALPADSSHPLAIGETIPVLSLAAAMLPRIEGRAVIRGAASGPHWYYVQFIGDPIVRERVVHPGYQRDPQRFLQILLDLWRASGSSSFDEFFPDDTNQ
jgi:hypothetical protein